MNRDKQIIEIKECIDAVYGADCAYFDVDGFAIADEIYNAGYRKQSEVIKEFIKRFEKHIGNCTFTMGQTNDIQYALKKATEEMKGENK